MYVYHMLQHKFQFASYIDLTVITTPQYFALSKCYHCILVSKNELQRASAIEPLNSAILKSGNN
jgi:hypothetical protein